MLNSEQSIEVDVPVSVAYNQYTQFEGFPSYMEGIKSVKQIDDTHLHWMAEVGGQTHEWDAEITEQRPDELIAWRSISGAHNSGHVTFREIEAGRTEVTAKMEVEPEGVLENIGGALGAFDRRVKGDLEKFRDYLESRGGETGGWRGEVADGEVLRDDASSSHALNDAALSGGAASSDELDPTISRNSSADTTRL